MTYRFYPGGPEALIGPNIWMSREDCGCRIAYLTGAEIPRTTYFSADPAVSQETNLRGTSGYNATAILPYEEP